MRLKPINRQVAVIVGTASGIGRETAHLFAANGAALVVADNDEMGLRTLVSEIQDRGGSAVPVVADVADRAQVQHIADTAVQAYGGFDTWAHVAAVGLYADFTATTPEEFQRVIDVNLMGQVYGAQVALQYLANTGGGALIHVSSIEGRRAFPYHSAYAAAKHGIDGFLEALRLELRHDRIPVSVTQILPASINTPFFDKSETKLGVKPMGVPPFYQPRAVAEAILYAAEHPARDIIVGGSGKTLLWAQRLSPSLLDAILLRTAFKGQKTNQPRSPQAPNDLFGPAGKYNRVEGSFGDMTLSHSLSTWLDTHPAAKAAAMVGAAVGVGALLGRRPPVPRVPVTEARRMGQAAYGTVRERVPVGHDNPNPDDRTLKDRVESEVFRDASVPKGQININVENGVVVLRGELGTPQAIDHVITRTRGVPNVRGVESYLHLPNTPAPNKESVLKVT